MPAPAEQGRAGWPQPSVRKCLMGRQFVQGRATIMREGGKHSPSQFGQGCQKSDTWLRLKGRTLLHGDYDEP